MARDHFLYCRLDVLPLTRVCPIIIIVTVGLHGQSQSGNRCPDPTVTKPLDSRFKVESGRLTLCGEARKYLQSDKILNPFHYVHKAEMFFR